MENRSTKKTSTLRMIFVLLILGIGLTWFFSSQFETLPSGVKPQFSSDLVFIQGQYSDIQRPGALLLVNFWATWCAPCLQELPVLVRVSRQFAAEVQCIGLSVDSPTPEVIRMQQQFQIPYPLAVAPWEMVGAWKAESLPMTYLLGPTGEIIWSHRGAVREAELVKAIQNALVSPLK